MRTDSVARPGLTIGLSILILIAAACGPGTSAGNVTGRAELDTIVGAALTGDSGALTPYFEYTRALCTTEVGLGGPPKCLAGEHDGTPVNVLPFLGPEGHFLRETDVDGWEAPRLTSLYAAYTVSDTAYSEEYYPAGEYALVFVGADPNQAPVTLQVTDGRIVRIDYGLSWPPQIPTQDVERYLVAPTNGDAP